MTAILLGPISLFIIYYGGIPFLVLTGVAFAISMHEIWNLCKKIKPFLPLFLALSAYSVLCYSSYLVLSSTWKTLPLLLVLLVASSDIGAYFFGKILEGPKMMPKISPNKTWAGFMGACLCPSLFYLGWSYFTSWDAIDFSIWHAWVGILIGIFGQAGDLLISTLKRKANVKDTGNILPGHGGILDRMDALMLCAPMFLVVTWFLIQG